MKHKKMLLLTTTALFTALVTVGTTVIQIPVGNGYTHFGDSVIYLAACILPSPCAVFAASAGAAFADIITGFAVYAPATAVIKALNALPFILMRIYLKRKNKDDKILSLQSCLMLIPTTFVTIFGYLTADYFMFGGEFAVASAITDGWLQPGGSLVVFIILAAAFDRINLKKRILRDF